MVGDIMRDMVRDIAGKQNEDTTSGREKLQGEGGRDKEGEDEERWGEGGPWRRGLKGEGG